MPFDLRYHPKVKDDDLPKLSAEIRDRIAKTIESRLATDPARYGVRLRGSLRDYRKFRVGDYRNVFELGEDFVRIIAVLHRKHAYERAERRI